MTNNVMELVEQAAQQVITALESRRSLMQGEHGTLGTWLFAAAGGDGEPGTSPHYVRGGTHGNFLCGVYRDGVMLWIDQHREIRVNLSSDPTASIAHLGNQDSRGHGNMWPTLAKGARWLHYSEMPESVRPRIHATIPELVAEAYQCWQEKQERKAHQKQREAEKRAAAQREVEQAWQ